LEVSGIKKRDQMPNQEITFRASGSLYSVRFTQNALYRLHKLLGRPLPEVARNPGAVEIQSLLWAGLEGARLKHKDRKEPFTLDEVGDLIDQIGATPAAQVVLDALKLAIPSAQGAAEVTDQESPFLTTEKA
jgi:hypothetical protein